MTTELPIAHLLKELNELRVELGKKPLSAWKSSRAKLVETIDQLDEEIMNRDPSESSTMPPAKKQAAKKKAAAKKKPAKKKKPTGKKRGPQPKNDGLLSVSDIARELGIDPKVARAKLRRHGQKATEGRWPRVKPNSKEHKSMIDLMQKGTRAAVKEDIE